MRERRAAGLLAALLLTCAASASADPLAPQMHTVAGGGSCSGALTSHGACDGVSATSVPIAGARDVTAVPGGGYVYVDYPNHMVRAVSKSGKVTTVAGNGTTVDAPNGTLAVNSGLDGPVSAVPLAGGGFLITEYDSSVVRVVSAGTPDTATITTIAGTGIPGNNGPGGPSSLGTSIQLNHPTDAEPMADGSVLIADTYNNYVRQLSAALPGATISTIAGSPSPGACNDITTSCEGMPAGQVAVQHPDSISPIQGGAGGYLIAEYDQSAIREVSAAGTFTTVAGTPGQSGYAGDGGPATAAELNHPQQVVSTTDGGFLVADTNNDVIRQVSAAGTITTIAGTPGVATFAGDGGAATSASLAAPAGVSPTTNGGILIADNANGLIREITIPPVSTIKLNPATPSGSNGWYVTPVQATVTATEKATINCEIDPTAPPPAFGALQSPCPFTGAGAAITGNGRHVLYAASQNSFGDAELPVSTTVNIDMGPPTLTCSQTPSFPFGAANAQVTATLSDAVSGPASQVISAPADTSSIGTSTVFVTGANNAGTAGVVSCRYKVVPLSLNPMPVPSWRFSTQRRYSTVRRLVVRRVPARAAVDVACSGLGCPFSARHLAAGKGCAGSHCRASRSRTVDLTALFAGSRLAWGTRLTVSVTKPHTIGRIVLFTIRAGKAATERVSCLAPASSVPGKGC